MTLDIITLIAAIIVAWLVFTALVSLLKTTIKTALICAAIVLILQLGFGIKPQEVWQQIIQLPQTILEQFQRR